jgi:hypothetical protein
MAVFCNKIGIGLTLLFLFLAGPVVFAQTTSNELGALKVIAVDPPVSISRNGEEIAVREWGLTLTEDDEIITGVGGKAYIFMSLLSQGNEIFLSSSTRVRISKIPTTDEKTIHNVEVVYGKVRAKVQLTPNQEIRISTLSSEIVSDDGEFIVEQNSGNAQIGASRGLIQLFSKRTNQGTVIPENSMATVFQTTGTVTMSSIPKRFKRGFGGPEDEEFDDVDDMSKLRKMAVKRQREMEMNLAEAEKTRLANEKAARDAAEKARREKEEQEKAEEAAKKAAQAKKSEDTAVKKDASADAQVMADLTEEPMEDQSLFMKYKWHIAATSTFVVFAYLATDEASKFNALDSENSSLQSQYASTSDTTTRTNLEVEYEVNKEKMVKLKSNIDLYNYISIAALGVEGYLLYLFFFSDDEPDTEEKTAKYHPWVPDDFMLTTNHQQTHQRLKLSASWKW